ncbi:MAG: S10 family serine carboxypeptidase-like protein, partial [Terracidiphilus sp.]
MLEFLPGEYNMMHFDRLFAVALAAAAALLAGSALAQDDKAATKSDKPAEAAPPPDSTTQGAIDVGGQHIAYTAIAGTVTVGSTDEQDAQLGADGKPQPGSQLALEEPDKAKDAPPVARMFYVAYFKTGAKAEDRPITFFYNGGPGSSTVWLHMGSLGPKHVVTAMDTHLPAAPYTMVDNPNSLLDVSDLVFVDMPGTGFSQIMGKEGQKAFWSIDGDAAAYARFIERFDTKYARWNSSKFIFGESYGTTRSAVLANLLENKYDTDLNGVILLSQIFNFTTDIDG